MHLLKLEYSLGDPGFDDWYTVWFDDVTIQKTDFSSEIIAENHYYPFGMQHKGYNNIVNGGNAVAQNEL